MKKEITCIICPNSCGIAIEMEGNEIKSIAGESCKKGLAYARQEIRDPRRTVTTLVKVKGGDLPLVSVRTTKPIPKDKIFTAMAEIKKMEIEAPVNINQVIIPNVANLDAKIIATKNVLKA